MVKKEQQEKEQEIKQEKKEEQTVETSKESTISEKIHETINDIKDSEALSEIKQYTNKYKQESLSMVAVALSVLITISQPAIGLFLIGLVLGINFTKEFIAYAGFIKHFNKKAGFFKAFLFGATLLGLLISSINWIGLLAGIGLAATTKYFIYKK